jgi:hypothetical protein
MIASLSHSACRNRISTAITMELNCNILTFRVKLLSLIYNMFLFPEHNTRKGIKVIESYSEIDSSNFPHDIIV